ncbi:unnamed protein product [Closterium sp. NIES-65]|nr:unnamed protein product [Closterium sp. NIES-65]
MGSAPVSATLHPSVLFSICDSFIRRNEDTQRVIGSLLGVVHPDGTVDIRNAYAVPHNEISDTVALDIEYHRTMAELSQRVNPKETIVGWYSTGSGVSPFDVLIHDFYTKEAGHPIHLTIDTTFQSLAAGGASGQPGGATSAVRAYVSTPLFIGEKQLAAAFQEIEVDMRMADAEKIGFDNLRTSVERRPADMEGLAGGHHGATAAVPLVSPTTRLPYAPLPSPVDNLRRTSVERRPADMEGLDGGLHGVTAGVPLRLPADMEGLEATMGRLQGMVDGALGYATDVVEGKMEADNEVGRALWDAVAAVPRISSEAFDRLFNNSVQVRAKGVGGETGVGKQEVRVATAAAALAAVPRISSEALDRLFNNSVQVSGVKVYLTHCFLTCCSHLSYSLSSPNIAGRAFGAVPGQTLSLSISLPPHPPMQDVLLVLYLANLSLSISLPPHPPMQDVLLVLYLANLSLSISLPLHPPMQDVLLVLYLANLSLSISLPPHPPMHDVLLVLYLVNLSLSISLPLHPPMQDVLLDVLLVLYLANLTRAQLALADKLNTAAQQL